MHKCFVKMVILCGCVLMSGCAWRWSTPDYETVTNAAGVPEWASKGAVKQVDKDKSAIYGVGAISGVRNTSLAWDAADNQARAQILKQFQTYTAYLMKDYAASVTADDFTKTTEEQNIERAVKTFASGTLTGVRAVDRWFDPSTQTHYVLVKLDHAQLAQALANNRDLSPQVRDYVRKNSEKLFKKLEDEEAKRSGVSPQ